MRMWMTDPKLLCKSHLLGEHGELHKHRHNFIKKHKIGGRVEPEVQIEPESMKARHDALAEEMLRRGMRHESPYEMPDLSYLPEKHRNAKVDEEKSARELARRCPLCRKRIQEAR